MTDGLDWRLVGRTASLFAGDVAAHGARIAEGVRGRRVLVVGGGGTIGGVTTRLLLEYAPAALHVVDLSENYLADLVRDIRGAGAGGGVDLRTWPLDFGGPIMRRLLAHEAPYDLVLNFAALKHVRSEKDAWSLLQMLDTNVVRQARFKEWLVARGGTARLFGVSTDKAANPTSLMGATKRLMEDVLLGHAAGAGLVTTSARFANVAFSNGSLLQAWVRRLALGQPLAVPRDTRRWFITQREAGEICLLAGVLGAHGDVFIPRLDPARELRLLEELAVEFLALHGYEAAPCADEAEARAAVPGLRAAGRWPLLLTPLDTSGEKPFEEFVGTGERAEEAGFERLLVVRRPAPRVDAAFLAALEARVQDADADKADIVRLLEGAVAGMRHVETGRHLDERM